MTLGDLIEKTARRFKAARLHYGHGTDNAHDEAAFLVLRALRLPFEVSWTRNVTPAGHKKIESLIRKRIEQRIPTAYLLNEAWLDDHSFYVDRRVIIPRSHIAELLRERLKPWLRRPVRRVLDLCTGSGCLAVLAAQRFARAEVDASDISPAALAVARINVGKYGLKKRVRLMKSDLFSAIEGSYDIIITNPPYVDRPSMKKLPREFCWEPGIALAGGADGLMPVKKIVKDSGRHLAPGGLLVCEIGDGRKALERAFPALDFLWPETAAGAGHVFVLQAPWRVYGVSDGN